MYCIVLVNTPRYGVTNNNDFVGFIRNSNHQDERKHLTASLVKARSVNSLQPYRPYLAASGSRSPCQTWTGAGRHCLPQKQLRRLSRRGGPGPPDPAVLDFTCNDRMYKQLCGVRCHQQS